MTKNNGLTNLITGTLCLMVVTTIALFSPVNTWAGEARTDNVSNRSSNKVYKIYMVLWRGITDAEVGFMDYFTQKQIDTNFMIRDCGKNTKRIPGIIQEIKRAKPDLIYTFGSTVASKVAGRFDEKNPDSTIRDIPIVANIVIDPLEIGLMPNLKKSGRNATAVSHTVPVLAQLERMKALLKLKRLGVIYNPAETNAVVQVEKLEKFSSQYNYTLIPMPFPSKYNKGGTPETSHFARVVAALADKKPDIIYLPSDSHVISNAKILVELINRYKISTFSATEGPIRKAGALMGLVSQYYDMGKAAASQAEQILVHQKDPGVMPCRMLSHFTFLFNRETAQKLNYTLPKKAAKFAESVGQSK